jgi:RNA polymerase sigma-70 factor (ECF subfamily)
MRVGLRKVAGSRRPDGVTQAKLQWSWRVQDDEKASPEPQPMNSAGGDTTHLFEEAVRANSRRLLAIARAIVGNRASPEDVVQQAVMNLFQHRARYDWREPGGLLRRAVVNEALRLLRSPKMSVVAEDQAELGPSTPDQSMDRRETVEKVRAAIDKLPEHYRSALVLCEYEQMPYAEIAKTLNASVPQIKTWIHRARRQLATMLKEYANA